MTMHRHDKDQLIAGLFGALWVIWAAVMFAGLRGELDVTKQIALAIVLAYFVWNYRLRDIYIVLLDVRYTVTLTCDGVVVACKECAFAWVALRIAKEYASEYSYLLVGREREAVQVSVNKNVVVPRWL